MESGSHAVSGAVRDLWPTTESESRRTKRTGRRSEKFERRKDGLFEVERLSEEKHSVTSRCEHLEAELLTARESVSRPRSAADSGVVGEAKEDEELQAAYDHVDVAELQQQLRDALQALTVVSDSRTELEGVAANKATSILSWAEGGDLCRFCRKRK